MSATSRFFSFFLTWAVCMVVATPCRGQERRDPRIDAESGRLRAVWPPDRAFDHLHMRLELDFGDLSVAEVRGVQHLMLTPVSRPQREVVLDCRGPLVESVVGNGEPLRFDLRNGKLRIFLAGSVQPGETAALEVRYTLDYSKNHGEGLTYSPARADAQSPTRQAPQVHAQGQAQSNSLWFPCHDYPNEQLTTELVVLAPSKYDVVSNGRLESRQVISDQQVRWEWVQDKPHAYYLVTVAIGVFAVSDVGGENSARPGIPMPVYVNVGNEENIEPIFGDTPRMMAFFERLFDEPYPWDKYAQACVRSFSAGGMENTSCTLLREEIARQGRAGSHDDLISHELAHQWFGNLVTCKGWAHLWLNEGWASYSECLWAEHKAGDDPAAGRRAYHRAVLEYAGSQRGRNRGFSPQHTPLVSNRYEHPDAVFSKRDDPYAKGAMVLHMLRERLGDGAFFEGARRYLDKHKFMFVETGDFRRCLEAASGQSLERFFTQWCYQPGLPRLSIDLDWDEGASGLRVSIEQTQLIDAHNPAYALVVPVRVEFEDGSTRWLEVPINSASTEMAFVLSSKPRQVNVDPNIVNLSANDVRKPLAWLMEEVVNGPSLSCRLDAAQALALIDHPLARGALARLAADPSQDSMLQSVARDATTALVSTESE